MDSLPDFNSLSNLELKELIKELTEEEMELSFDRRVLHEKLDGLRTEEAQISDARRVLHGKIDIARAELVNRLRQKYEGGDDVGGGGPPGVREPRRPSPQLGTGGVSLPPPEATDDNLHDPPPPLASDQ